MIEEASRPAQNLLLKFEYDRIYADQKSGPWGS